MILSVYIIEMKCYCYVCILNGYVYFYFVNKIGFIKISNLCNNFKSLYC